MEKLKINVKKDYITYIVYQYIFPIIIYTLILLTIYEIPYVWDCSCVFVRLGGIILITYYFLPSKQNHELKEDKVFKIVFRLDLMIFILYATKHKDSNLLLWEQFKTISTYLYGLIMLVKSYLFYLDIKILKKCKD